MFLNNLPFNSPHSLDYRMVRQSGIRQGKTQPSFKFTRGHCQDHAQDIIESGSPPPTHGSTLEALQTTKVNLGGSNLTKISASSSPVLPSLRFPSSVKTMMACADYPSRHELVPLWQTYNPCDSTYRGLLATSVPGIYL